MTLAPYSGWTFWALLAGLVATHALLTRMDAARSARNLAMIALSLAVVVLAHGADRWAWVLLLFLLGLVVGIYQVGRRLAEESSATRNRLAWTAVALIVLVLCYFKYSVIYEPLDLAISRLAAVSYRHLVLLGVSYFAFKFIHFLVECRRKSVGELDLLTFVNYILFFPSFFAGPINRYADFARDMGQALSPDYLEGGKRIITGLFKKVVLAASLYPYSFVALDLADPELGPWRAILSVYAYAFYIYFDFAGYTDMALGAGRMVGLQLPENFDYPFLRRNLQKFWANWHMSLTAWLTDYVYWPLVRKLRHARVLEHRPVSTSSLAIVITFMVCGVWHGDGVTFLIWGTYHGVGLALLNLYTHVVKKYFSKRWRIFVKRSPVAYGVSNFVTVQYVVFGFLLFGSDVAGLREFFTVIT